MIKGSANKGLCSQIIHLVSLRGLYCFIDGDLYQSHKSTLENLYGKVSNGGVIIFDDIFYGSENSEPFPGARTAVKEFFNDKYNLLKVSVGGNLYCLKNDISSNMKIN